jgi:hypothetical protein
MFTFIDFSLKISKTEYAVFVYYKLESINIKNLANLKRLWSKIKKKCLISNGMRQGVFPIPKRSS